MFKPLQPIVKHYRQIAVVISLVFATGVCLALLVGRMVHSGAAGNVGLAWNLFLAWLPLLCALTAYNLHKRRSRLSWLVVAGCALSWLLFFPNAPYLLTEIMYLRPRPGVPLWYDLIMVIAFAWTGMFLGLVSLSLMQVLVRRAAGRLASWLFALGVLGVSGFGIYLGRFLRWNSWDVLFQPASLLADVLPALQHPLAYWRTFAFSSLLSLFLVSAYLMYMALSHWQLDAPEPEAPPALQPE